MFIEIINKKGKKKKMLMDWCEKCKQPLAGSKKVIDTPLGKRPICEACYEQYEKNITTNSQ